jgi:hypothetical protein
MLTHRFISDSEGIPTPSKQPKLPHSRNKINGSRMARIFASSISQDHSMSSQPCQPPLRVLCCHNVTCPSHFIVPFPSVLSHSTAQHPTPDSSVAYHSIPPDSSLRLPSPFYLSSPSSSVSSPRPFPPCLPFVRALHFHTFHDHHNSSLPQPQLPLVPASAPAPNGSATLSAGSTRLRLLTPGPAEGQSLVSLADIPPVTVVERGIVLAA